MADLEPLTATEEAFWRALMRIVLTLPRHLHNDMVRASQAGLTAAQAGLKTGKPCEGFAIERRGDP